MRRAVVSFLRGLCVLALLMIAPCAAEDAPPGGAPKQIATEGNKDVQKPVATAPATDPCAATKATFTASIVQATGESLQRKRWQPQGGVIQFTMRSFGAIPGDASFFVCYRWQTADPSEADTYKQVRPDRLDRNNNDGTTWTITSTIPSKFEPAPAGKVQTSALPLVPMADVRIVAVKDNNTVAYADTMIGITKPWLAIAYALVTIIFGFYVLSLIPKEKLPAPGVQQAPWALRIISTANGRASLSQFQIVLWTLVTAASVVYVMALSGELIQITDGTLVLLGIAGAAAIGSKVQGDPQVRTAQAAAASAQKDADQAKTTASQPEAPQTAKDAALRAQGVADSKAQDVAKLKAPQAPQWYDLLLSPSVQNGEVREVDVTRFQLLLFTLIAAAFVLMNVVTTYAIPDIPPGFLILMGISNGVYLGGKVAQN